MHDIATLATLFVAVLHFYIMFLEMFLWNAPLGRKTFGLTPEFASSTKVLAANQGLYNGFLGAGLIWGLLSAEAGDPIKIFFLSCVIVAGIYGAATSKVKILFIQALPAAFALTLLFLSRP